MFRNLLLAGFCIATWLAAPAHAQEKAPPPEQIRFFETSIRPLLVERCQKCHGAKKQEGSLRLDAREHLLKGGDSGPAVVVGKPDKSLLIHAVRHTTKSLQMPDGGKKLSDREIADLTRWV